MTLFFLKKGSLKNYQYHLLSGQRSNVNHFAKYDFVIYPFW